MGGTSPPEQRGTAPGTQRAKGDLAPSPDLVRPRGFLHLLEGGEELADEVVLAPGVVVPDHALQGQREAAAPRPGLGTPGAARRTYPAPHPVLTRSLLLSSQLHSEFSETLKGSHTGLRLFFTTCGGEEAAGGSLRQGNPAPRHAPLPGGMEAAAPAPRAAPPRDLQPPPGARRPRASPRRQAEADSLSEELTAPDGVIAPPSA